MLRYCHKLPFFQLKAALVTDYTRFGELCLLGYTGSKTTIASTNE